VPDDLINQAIKEVVMHEVGHTLGLRHNFKASTMLKHDQLNDVALTRKQGLTGSVMDYNPINLAPKGVKQGDYFTTTIGPYDYWAIEYAYKPLTGGTDGEAAELQKIAAKCAQSGLDYGTDEDMFGTSDPLIQAFDLGADPMKFAQDRMLLAEELLKDLAERIIDKGEGYQKTRQAFNMLLSQYADAAYLCAQFVGAEHIHRDHRGDSSRDPLEPVQAAKQREALKFLQEHILTEKPFQFSPQLMRKLAADRWWHWGNEGVVFSNVEYPLAQRVLGIQRIVLGHMYSPAVLSRVQNIALKADKEEQPLTVAEVFRCLTDGIWKEYQSAGVKPDPKKASVAILRRNLQREHLRELTNLVLGRRSASAGGSFIMFMGGSSSTVPPDARSLARMHLREINSRIDTVLKVNLDGMDDTTRAHLEECQERIAKVLSASMQVNEP
jgi:Met-zincin